MAGLISTIANTASKGMDQGIALGSKIADIAQTGTLNNQWQQDLAFQREKWRTQTVLQMLQDRQKAHEAQQALGLQTRQVANTEKAAALANHASEYALRKAIEDQRDGEDITKNLMVGMMSSIGTMRGAKNGR